MYFQWAPAVVFLASIRLIVLSARLSSGSNADAHDMQEESHDLNAVCREYFNFDEPVSTRRQQTISARTSNQDSVPLCRNSSISLSLSSKLAPDERQLRTRDTSKENETRLRKRSNEALPRRMMQDLSNMDSKEIASKAEIWESRLRNFRQTSLPYKQAVDLAKKHNLSEKQVIASYVEAAKTQKEIFTEEVRSLTKLGRYRDAAVYDRATTVYLTTMLAYKDMIFVDASKERLKRHSFTGALHRRQSGKERLAKRVWISKEIERRAKHMEYIAQNFKQFSGSYGTAVDWARSKKWPEPKIKTAYFAAKALRERELAQEVENLKVTGRAPDAARIREAADAYLDAWQRNWATVLADASEGKATHTTTSESSKPAGGAGGILRRTSGAHQPVKRVWTPEEVERRAAELEHKARHFRTASYVYLRLVATARSRLLQESSVREALATARRNQEKIFIIEVGNLEDAGRTQDAQRYRRATDAFMAAFDQNVEFLSTDAGKSPEDPTNGHFDGVLRGKFWDRVKNGANGKHKDGLRRREAKIERRTRFPWDSAEVERRAKELEAVAANFKESRVYKRALEIGRNGELNEVKMKQVYFGARAASAERYNRIVLELRWAWRTRDADRYRKAADKVLEAWDRSYFAFLADLRRLAEKTTKDEGTSKSDDQGPHKGRRNRSGLKKGFLL